MRQIWRDFPEACDNTLLVAERCEVAFNEGANLMPRFPVPAGETEDSWLVKEVERGLAKRFPGGRHRRAPRPRRLRARRDPDDGLPRLLPRGRRPGPPRQGVRHPGRPGPRFGRRFGDRVRDGDHRARPGRVRPAVRALPQPRAHLDARHRPRLRRAPARRHDPLRHRALRRGAGRADHHVRNDQGQAGGQGLHPRARLPVRARRPDHEGAAAADHGQGHAAARRSSTSRTPATRRAPSSARCTRPTAR